MKHAKNMNEAITMVQEHGIQIIDQNFIFGSHKLLDIYYFFCAMNCFKIKSLKLQEKFFW